MTDFTKYLPSDDALLSAFRATLARALDRSLDESVAAEPLRALIRAAVERAVADERARHAHEIERARSLLRSLVEHKEIAGRSLVRLSTSYRLAEAALAALDGEEEQ